MTSAIATPMITHTSSANPASVSTAVTFTTSLTSAAGTPTGSITFYDGTAQLGSANVSSNMATYTTSSLVAGAHTITAVYSGNSNFSSVTNSAPTQTLETFTLGAPGGGTVPAQSASPPGAGKLCTRGGPTQPFNFSCASYFFGNRTAAGSDGKLLTFLAAAKLERYKCSYDGDITKRRSFNASIDKFFAGRVGVHDTSAPTAALRGAHASSLARDRDGLGWLWSG